MNSDTNRLSLRVVLGSMAGVWLCYYILTTIRGTIFGLELQDELLWRRAVVCFIGIGLTFLLWLVVRFAHRLALKWQMLVGLLAALPASLMVAQANETVFAPMQGKAVEELGASQGVRLRLDEAGNLLLDLPAETVTDVGVGDRTITIVRAPQGVDRWQQLLGAALGPYFLLLAWVAIYFALLAGARAREAERREERFRSAAKAAELRSLRYQVNPHFLFNALNSLSALVITGKPDKAEEMIQTISRFYRHSLAEDPTSDVALEDEFDLQRHYLAIETVRFPKRLRTHFHLPVELAGCRVPGMILQPLVENSVKYGVTASSRPVTVTLSAREEYGRLVLTVADDGPGETAGKSGGFGIGLANVRDRLAARFGEEASISSGPTLDGYETELRLPLVRHG